jgi:hypothetical protein
MTERLLDRNGYIRLHCNCMVKTRKGDALTVRFEAGRLAMLRTVQERDGVPVAEQIRRAVDAWLSQRDVSTNPKGKGRTK